MARADNLISLADRPVEEHREISRKGGRVRSAKKKLAARVRELKKKGVSKETLQSVLDALEDPEIDLLDTKLFLDVAKAKAASTGNVTDMVKVGQVLLDWHKARHGSKNVNLNVSAQAYWDELFVRIEGFGDGQGCVVEDGE